MTDRDKNGRFQKGHSTRSPGRPARRVERDYLEKLTSKLTLAKWSEIVDQAIKQAIQGDSRARQWLADYVIGKPAQILELKSQDTALLAEVLEALSESGLEPSAVFEAMLNRIALEAAKNDTP